MRWDRAQIKDALSPPTISQLGSRGRHPGTRRVNTDYSLFSFRHQMSQKISQLSSHHNLLKDKLRVISLPLHFM